VTGSRHPNHAHAGEVPRMAKKKSKKKGKKSKKKK